MANRIRTGDPRGFNKGRSSKFREGSWVQQTPEEGRRTYRPKRCGNNNKNENNSPKNLNDKNQQASSQKFRQLTDMSISYCYIFTSKENMLTKLKRDRLMVYNKTITFIKPQAEICICWPGKETVLTLCSSIKCTSIYHDWFSSFYFLSLMCICSSCPYNPAMHYLQETNPFLTLTGNNLDIFC